MRSIDHLLTKAILKAIIELGNPDEPAYNLAVKLIKDPKLSSYVFIQYPELKDYLAMLSKNPRFKKVLIKSISLITVLRLALVAVMISGLLNVVVAFASSRLTGISPVDIKDLKNIKQRLIVCATYGFPKALVSTSVLQFLRKNASKVIREVLSNVGLEELAPDVEARIIGTWRQVFTYLSRSISDVAKYNVIGQKIAKYIEDLAKKDDDVLSALLNVDVAEPLEVVQAVRYELEFFGKTKELMNFDKELAKAYTTVTLKAKLPSLILKFAFAVLDKLFTKYSDKISKRTNLDPDLLNFLYDLIKQVTIKCA